MVARAGRLLVDQLLDAYSSMAEQDMMGMARMYASMVFDHVAPDDPECLTQACLARAVNVSPRELDKLWDIFDQVGCITHTHGLWWAVAHTPGLWWAVAHAPGLWWAVAHTPGLW